MQSGICFKSKCRFGLCCIFLRENIRFRTLYAINLRALKLSGRLKKISEVCLSNSENLKLAIDKAAELGIGAFRINSKFLPLYTHPDMKYELIELPDYKKIMANLEDAKKLAKKHDIRLSFHPDQFVILSSPKEEVVRNSIEELEYHGLLAELLEAEVINIHIGGRYESKSNACARFQKNFERLSEKVKKRLTIENDDIIYNVEDVESLSEKIGIPFVYDIHHHRCNRDGLSEEEAEKLCIRSWKKSRPDQEPYFHISSSKTPDSREHSDYIYVKDFPLHWLEQKVTIDIEAKAKELAILKLYSDLGGKSA